MMGYFRLVEVRVKESPAVLEFPPQKGLQRRKAIVKIRRNSQLLILPMIRKINTLPMAINGRTLCV